MHIDKAVRSSRLSEARRGESNEKMRHCLFSPRYIDLMGCSMECERLLNREEWKNLELFHSSLLMSIEFQRNEITR